MRVLTEAWRRWNAIDGSRLAAAMTFYAMLSLAPFLILIVAIGGWWLGTEAATHYLSTRIADLTGPDAGRLVDRLVGSRDFFSEGHGWAAALGAAITIVGATAAYAELQRALNLIFGEIHRPALAALLRARALSFGLVVATGLLLVISLVLSIGVTMFVNHETRIAGIGASAIANELIGFAVIAIAFATLLRVLPDRPPHVREVAYGAIVSSALFVTGKYFIGTYVTHLAVRSTYGAAGTVVVIMLWIYFTALIFLAGAVFASLATGFPGDSGSRVSR